MADESRAKRAAGSGDAEAKYPLAYALKALFTTIGGALLTRLIFYAETTYTNHLEALHRQDAQGVELQARLLDLTGRIEGELDQIVNLLRRSDDPDPARRNDLLGQARARFAETLDPIYAEWQRDRLLLRNRAAQIYGLAVGELVYRIPDDSIEPNNCSVSAQPDDPPSSADCHGQRQQELALIAGVTRDVLHARSLAPFASEPRLSPTFQANAYAARVVIYRYLNCAQHPGGALDCTELPTLLRMAEHRLDLVRFARENLASAITSASSLR